MKIGNFNIEQQNGNTIVSYHRTFKDWMDIFIPLILGAAALVFIVTMYIHTRFQEWIYWLIAALFGFFSFLKLTTSITKLTQSTRSIIIVDQAEKKLIAKYPYLKKTIINLTDINKIQLNGINERIKMTKYSQIRTYCKIEVLDKQGKSKTILLINPKQIFRISDKKIEVEVYNTGQGIAKFLSEQVGVKYQWKGFHTENT